MSRIVTKTETLKINRALLSQPDRVVAQLVEGGEWVKIKDFQQKGSIMKGILPDQLGWTTIYDVKLLK